MTGQATQRAMGMVLQHKVESQRLGAGPWGGGASSMAKHPALIWRQRDSRPPAAEHASSSLLAEGTRINPALQCTAEPI